MRMSVGLTAGLAAIALAGCATGGAAVPTSGAPAASASRGPAATTATAAPPASSRVRAGARQAAVQFYDLYSARHFAALWNQLSPTTRRLIGKQAWVSVHDGCASGGGKSRVIKGVTVFGNAAIVTEGVAGASSRPGTTEDVFNFANGRWHYSPANPSIYRHRSVAADIAAARAAGNCASWKIF